MPAGMDRSISAETNVDLLLDRFPAAAPVFIARRMHCVGCPVARFETLADVCAIYKQSLDSLLKDLRAAAEARGATEDGGTSR